jgi:hypothetical protein
MNRAWIASLALASLPLPAIAAFALSCSSGSVAATASDSGALDTSMRQDTSTPNEGGEAGPTPEAATEAGTDATDAPAEAYVVPGTNFAFKHYYLGDTDRTGTTSANAWTAFGTNIDGKTTTATSTDVCTLPAGATMQVQVDGVGGIDNSWGANIMTIFESIDPTFSQLFNQFVTAGTFTSMVDVVGLTSDPMQTAAAQGWGFEGASFAGTPTWTVADDWPVFPNWLNDGGLPNGSKIAFPTGSIAAGVWQSGAPTDFPILLPAGLQAIELVIHHATVTFTHATPTTAAGGVLGGIFYTQELLAQLSVAFSYEFTSLCASSAWDSIAMQIQQDQDILHDGTNTAGPPCDAISVGIGFDGAQIGPVQTVSPAHVPLESACDGGSD